MADNTPPLVVVTVKVTGMLDIGLPFELVAMTSSGDEAVEFGKSNCPLPEEILSADPAP